MNPNKITFVLQCCTWCIITTAMILFINYSYAAPKTHLFLDGCLVCCIGIAVIVHRLYHWESYEASLWRWRLRYGYLRSRGRRPIRIVADLSHLSQATKAA